MFKIFGGKQKEKAPTTQEAIQKLRTTEELLQKKSDFLEKKIDQELQMAKKNASKNKRSKLVNAFTLNTKIFNLNNEESRRS